MHAEHTHFVDTNILVYLFSADEGKSTTAEQLIKHGGTISVQVLNELTNVTRRKLSMPWDEVREFTQTMRTIFTVSPLTERTYELGIQFAEQYVLSIYDAMIVAAAVENSCTQLFSEDMHNGLIVENSLTIVNPFD